MVKIRAYFLLCGALSFGLWVGACVVGSGQCQGGTGCPVTFRCVNQQCIPSSPGKDGGGQVTPDARSAPDTRRSVPPDAQNNPDAPSTERPSGSDRAAPQDREPPKGCTPNQTRPCYSGDKETQDVGICKAGTQTCTQDRDWGSCKGEVTSEQEICGDGKDNDCDGNIDEKDAGCQCTPGEKRPCGESKGACKQGTITCGPDGSWGRCEGAVEPSSEICDGKDNDCDGQVDEDWPGVGSTCRVGKGACEKSGKLQCLPDGSGTECPATPGTPGTEECNGIDDNCDGQIDENLQRSCYSGAASTKGVGLCKAGSQTCEKGQWSACKGEVLPSKGDPCDGKDNDCDGKVDNGCKCTPNQTQSCGTSTGVCKTGTQTCSGLGQWGACKGAVEPSSEICDGKDNDCDGDIDEDFANKGKTCSAGKGACLRKGTYICSGDGAKLLCDAKPALPTKEVCDGIDNDCDGKTDESLSRSCYDGPNGTKGVGPCKAGSQSCSNGKWGACAGQVLPKKETCNGVDDNCNGSVDEAFKLGAKCSSGKGACLRLGKTVCNAAGTGTTCSAVAGKPTAELCDGIDNDCDGKIDEDFSRKGNPCTKGVGACLRKGTYVCNAKKDGTACSATAGSPSAEKCNTIDDDCDGTVDEGPFGPCSIGGCPGRYACSQGVLRCLQDPRCCGSGGRICP